MVRRSSFGAAKCALVTRTEAALQRPWPSPASGRSSNPPAAVVARGRRRPRLLVLMAIVATVCVVIPATASAFTGDDFWTGYLRSDSPDGCWVGCVQGPFNNWEWAGMDKQSGDCINLGFIDSSGYIYISGALCSGYNGLTSGVHVTRSGLNAPTYNRTFCSYWSGSQTYGTCWSEIP